MAEEHAPSTLAQFESTGYAPNTFKHSLQAGPSEWSALERNAKHALLVDRPPATAPQGGRPAICDYSIAASEDIRPR